VAKFMLEQNGRGFQEREVLGKSKQQQEPKSNQGEN
jgi:hypothetical protein